MKLESVKTVEGVVIVNRQRKKYKVNVFPEFQVDSDLSSPDGPDTATPKLPEDEGLVEGYDDDESDYDRSSTPGILYFLQK